MTYLHIVYIHKHSQPGVLGLVGDKFNPIETYECILIYHVRNIWIHATESLTGTSNIKKKKKSQWGTVTYLYGHS